MYACLPLFLIFPSPFLPDVLDIYPNPLLILLAKVLVNSSTILFHLNSL
ncbi:hypothetical protein PMIT1320_00186 [Prochlorococcus marinus str. MIT 1320]|nr:hypothetical protein PMIT1320_00186 [Prochlorococcus marinus str. MIT 1320]